MGSSAIEDNTGTEYSDTLDNEMYATSDNNGDNSSTLKAYTAYGIVYHSSNDNWSYKGKQIAGLIASDNVYIDGSVVDNPIYLQIKNNSAKEISKKQFKSLVETAN